MLLVLSVSRSGILGHRTGLCLDMITIANHFGFIKLHSHPIAMYENLFMIL